VVDEITPVRVHARLTVEERHLQPYGIVHGGVYAAVAEAIASIGAAVSARTLDPESGVVGLDNHTSFLRAARAGTEILAEARPRHAGRRTQSWDVTMRDPDGRELAVSRVRLLVAPLSGLPHGRFP
jgi:1,4-dihydroxy-2-naphthoyl-CoA hydrolase